MRKVLLLFAVVVALSGCQYAIPYSAATFNVGDFSVLVDSYRYADMGDYQVGVRLTEYGSIDIETFGGITIDGATAYSRIGAGEYWFFIDTSGMTAGDVGTIETTVIDGSYYDVPEYKTYTLMIEVQ